MERDEVSWWIIGTFKKRKTQIFATFDLMEVLNNQKKSLATLLCIGAAVTESERRH